jgi:homoserine dehydrogenase
MQEIGIGLLGFGTVGAGVIEGLQKNGDVMAERLGVRLVVRRIADLDIESDRGVTIAPGVLTTDANAVIDDPAVDVVIELVGGTGVAKSFVLRALAQGKPVVTANKALLAKHGAEIFGLAVEQQTDIYFGASVGGGIPIIRALREGLIANQIESIWGILNGTCNYILTRMENEGLAFDDILKQAQELGYAEADPTLDVEGFDTAHKAAILASLAYGATIPFEAVQVEGITGITALDLSCAHEFGYRIKLLAVIKRRGESIEVSVAPTLVPLDHMLASVSGVFNAVMVRSDLADDTLYYGRGAGREPTASTVLGDVADVARNLAHDATHRVPAVPRTGQPIKLLPPDEIQSCYYLRLSVKDVPGVLASITDILGKAGISLAQVQQQGRSEGEYVPLVVITHEAAQADAKSAIKAIDALATVEAGTVCIRIEQ